MTSPGLASGRLRRGALTLRWPSSTRLAALDGFGGAHDPRLVSTLAGPGGWIDSLDVILVGRGTGGLSTQRPHLVHRPDLANHPRALLAADIRDDLTLLGYEDRRQTDIVILAQGLAGLRELSFELEPSHRGGGGPGLLRDALSMVPSGELVVAATAPGNVASLRSLLSVGFAPIGSLQLFRRAREPAKPLARTP